MSIICHQFLPRRKKDIMNIFITGGCGFAGSNIATALINQGHQITCFDNLSRHGSTYLKDRICNAGARFIHGDIRNKQDLDAVPGSFDIMIDCAAEPSVLMGTRGDDAAYVLDNNLIGSLNCFEWARKRDAAVLFLSTSRIYPYNVINNAQFEVKGHRFEYAAENQLPGISPDGVTEQCPLTGIRSLYGATKLACEFILAEYAAAYDLPCVINRCGVLAGPWQLGKADQGVFTFWLVRHVLNKPLKYIGFGGSGHQVRDLLHIGDLIDLLTIQIEQISTMRGEIYNVGGGHAISLSLRETTDICRQLTGINFDVLPELSGRPADMPWYITDSTHACNTFHWTPTRDAATILEDTYRWLSDNASLIPHLFA